MKTLKLYCKCGSGSATIRANGSNEEERVKKAADAFWEVHDQLGCGPCDREEYVLARRRRRIQERKVTA
jgi:hypothetical protein